MHVCYSLTTKTDFARHGQLILAFDFLLNFVFGALHVSTKFYASGKPLVNLFQ